jgi:hypothetical protein
VGAPAFMRGRSASALRETVSTRSCALALAKQLPGKLALYQGTTLVVKFQDILYRLSPDIPYTFCFLVLIIRRSRRKGKWETLCVFQGGCAAVFSFLSHGKLDFADEGVAVEDQHPLLYLHQLHQFPG